MPSVGSTPVSLGQSGQLIQNLGPDDLYVQPFSGVTVQSGFRIPSGKSVAVGYANGGLYAVSAGTSEVRTLGGGTGMFSSASE